MSEKIELKCKYEAVEELKSPQNPQFFGVRHLQILMMFITVTVLVIVRSGMGVAILAMTEKRNTSDVLENLTDSSTDGMNITEGGTREPPYSETYDWDEKIQGAILSAFFWGYTLNQIPGGIVAQKFGAKPILLGSLLVNGVVCFSLPFIAKIGGWRLVVVMRCLTGLTQCLFPCLHDLLGKWAPPQERTVFSTIAFVGMQVGTVISMPLCGVLSRTVLGWKMIFYAMAGITMVTAVLWQLFAASSPAQHRLIKSEELAFIERSLSRGEPKDEKSPPIPWRAIVTSVPMAALLIAHIGSSWTFTIFFAYTPNYMNHVLGIGVRNSGILSALPFLAQWICAMAFSTISQYVTNRKKLTPTESRKLFNSIGHFGPSIGLMALSYTTKDHPALAIFILCLTVGTQGSIHAGFMINHLDLSPRYAGVLLGITNAIASLLASQGPVITGVILGDDATDLSRWRILFFATVAITVLSNIVFIIWGTAERQPWDAAEFNTAKQELDLPKEVVLKEEKIYKFEGKLPECPGDAEVERHVENKI